jgi:hypothetical protein
MLVIIIDTTSERMRCYHQGTSLQIDRVTRQYIDYGSLLYTGAGISKAAESNCATVVAYFRNLWYQIFAGRDDSQICPNDMSPLTRMTHHLLIPFFALGGNRANPFGSKNHRQTPMSARLRVTDGRACVCDGDIMMGYHHPHTIRCLAFKFIQDTFALVVWVWNKLVGAFRWWTNRSGR